MAVLQLLLGDAKEDRESLLLRLVSNDAQTPTANDFPIALVVSSDDFPSFKRAALGEICDQWKKAISSEYEYYLVNKS